RREQILLSDQDNAIVFANGSLEENALLKHYFLSLANKINVGLHEIGFDYCPAEMMANNPRWCLSLGEWKNQFHDWITVPSQEKMMLCTIFFDFQDIYGDKNLISELTESIFKSIDEYPIFLNHFALNAIKTPPPLSFFRQFLVEHSGEHKDQFDIKLKAIMPLVDAARVLIFSNKISGINNTLKRFERLMELEPQNADIYSHCIEAYTTLLSFRASYGLLNKNTGRYIDIKQLNKADRLKLKNCFKPIQEVQKLIQTRFQLAQLM
ncbi:MAG: putative nucleotidyltransferase substrate binding domain-containing protein, partial [Lutimonas sp.]